LLYRSFKLTNVLIKIENPESRPLTYRKLKITDDEAITQYYKAITEGEDAKSALTSAMSTLKMGEDAEIPLSSLSDATGMIMLTIRDRAIHPTLIIFNCKSLKQLNLQLALTQILQEDISLSLGLEPNMIVAFTPKIRLDQSEV